MKKVLLCFKDTNYSKHCHRYIFEKKKTKHTKERQAYAHII